MTARVALVPFYFAATFIGFGQTPAPSSICAADQEEQLKARVNEFFQYHVDAKYAKAIAMVAEDTQDEYFASGKMKLKSFKLDSLKFTDNCTKAVATNIVVRDWQIRMQNNEVTLPMTTTWKIEDGKWVWYHDIKGAWLTPMGPSDIDPPRKNADGTPNLPKTLSPEVIAAAAKAILQRSNLSKDRVALNAGKTSSDRVTFTNAIQGTVTLTVSGGPELPGFEAKLDKATAAAGETVSILISYDPKPGAAAPEPFVLHVTTEPLNQVFDIKVSFSDERKGPERE